MYHSSLPFLTNIFRLSKYNDFASLAKLQSMLGNTEDKVHQARGQGSHSELWKEEVKLSAKFSTKGKNICRYSTDDKV